MANKKVTDLVIGTPIQSTDVFLIARGGVSYQASGINTMALQASTNVSITGGTISGITDLAVADGGTGASSAAAARTNLGLVIGTDVQPYSARLATAAIGAQGIATWVGANGYAGRTLTGTANQVIITNGDGQAGNPTFTLPQSIGTSSPVTFASVTTSGNVTVGAVLQQAKGADLASAATVDLNTATANTVDITGTTTITSFGSAATIGSMFTVRFTGVLTLTHSANLILPSGSNYTTTAGDVFQFVHVSSGVWSAVAWPVAAAAATQAQMEAATSNSAIVTPLRLQSHPATPKAWVRCGITGNILASYNVTSLTDVGVGQVNVTLTTAFSSTNYVANATSDATSNICAVFASGTSTASLAKFQAYNVSNVLTDPTGWNITLQGDQ